MRAVTPHHNGTTQALVTRKPLASTLHGPETTFIIRPNADTLYGGVILDVRTQPMVIGIPEMYDYLLLGAVD